MDESGFSEGGVVRRTWAPRGHTPVLRPRGRSWRWMSAIGAVAYTRRPRKARVFLLFQPGPVRTPGVLRFLRHLRRHLRGTVILLWDGLRCHRAAAVRHFIAENERWLQVETLPPYAPELNAVEGLWSWLKGTSLANVCESDLYPLVARARNGAKRLRHKQEVLHGFLGQAGLSL